MSFSPARFPKLQLAPQMTTSIMHPLQTVLILHSSSLSARDTSLKSVLAAVSGVRREVPRLLPSDLVTGVGDLEEHRGGRAGGASALPQHGAPPAGALDTLSHGRQLQQPHLTAVLAGLLLLAAVSLQTVEVQGGAYHGGLVQVHGRVEHLPRGPVMEGEVA